jgi:acyl phosphate:glycerol-3-phosphate acyltransferase
MIPGVIAVLLGYLLGSIPFGLLLTRAAGLGDIRAVGSGNIGATNVLRTGRKDVAAATLLLDGAKGVLAVFVIRYWAGDDPALLAGVAAVIGHCTSPWVGFKGGKGVATALGVVLAWAWPVGIACLLVWLAAAYLSKRSSVGSLTSMAASPVLLLLWAGPAAAVAGLVVAVIAFARHHENIARLLAGTEPRIGQGR